MILLTKADACEEPRPPHLASPRWKPSRGRRRCWPSRSRTGQGLADLSARLAPGKTAVLLGSSGVGKSTLVNALAEAPRLTGHQGDPRETTRTARHTTTHREVESCCPPRRAHPRHAGDAGAGALEDAEAGVAAAFAETTDQVAEIAEGCRFRDCAHDREPGCAVRAALEDGTLDEARWLSFRKLQRELAHTVRKEDPLAASAERKRWAAIHKAGRARMKSKREFDD